jgi:putative membrane protein insertion efficiency factor
MRQIGNRLGIAVSRALIRGYQLSFSALLGRECRHFPSCSDYADEAIGRFGVWAGGWMGFARLCRCHPFGTSGIDLVPARLPAGGSWYKPWRYGRWRGVNAPPVCDAVDPDAASSQRS